MKDWVLLLTAIIQCYTAIKLSRRDNKKGTPRKRPRKRK